MIRDTVPYRGGARILRRALLAAGAGLLLFLLGVLQNPRRALFGYLVSYAWVVSIALGALVFLMIVHTMNATWPVALRRLTEAIAGTLPLCLVLFIPLAIGMGALFPWVHPDRIADARDRELVLHKHGWLNPPFFVARAALYLLVWAVLGGLLRRWSLRQDEDGSPSLKRWQRMLSAGGLPLLGFTLTFASFDWLMSLEPTWFSTMFGFYFFAGGILAALALLSVLLIALQRVGYLNEMGGSHYYALGRCLLTFVVFWAYVAFFQFFLIWIADKPIEVPWYLTRMRTSWKWESVALLIAHFAIPFFLLLPYRTKRLPTWLWLISFWLLLIHYFDVHWLTVPSGYPESFTLSYLDIGGALLNGGLFTATIVWVLHGRPLVPKGDPAYPAALGYHST